MKKNDKIQVSSYPGERSVGHENRVGTWVAGKAFKMEQCLRLCGGDMGFVCFSLHILYSVVFIIVYMYEIFHH